MFSLKYRTKDQVLSFNSRSESIKHKKMSYDITFLIFYMYIVISKRLEYLFSLFHQVSLLCCQQYLITVMVIYAMTSLYEPFPTLLIVTDPINESSEFSQFLDYLHFLWRRRTVSFVKVLFKSCNTLVPLPKQSNCYCLFVCLFVCFFGGGEQRTFFVLLLF